MLRRYLAGVGKKMSLHRFSDAVGSNGIGVDRGQSGAHVADTSAEGAAGAAGPALVVSWRQNSERPNTVRRDRKSTRLNSSHGYISYAVFCLKKKKKTKN